jgi:hypothetical protein
VMAVVPDIAPLRHFPVLSDWSPVQDVFLILYNKSLDLMGKDAFCKFICQNKSIQHFPVKTPGRAPSCQAG